MDFTAAGVNEQLKKLHAMLRMLFAAEEYIYSLRSNKLFLFILNQTKGRINITSKKACMLYDACTNIG